MFYSLNEPSPEMRWQYADLVNRSTPEQTPDGFEYFVTQPGEVGGLLAGEVFRTADTSELLLIVDGVHSPQVRSDFASVTVAVEEELHAGRYQIAYAADKALGFQEPNGDTPTNPESIKTLHQYLNTQKAVIRQDKLLSPEKKKFLLDLLSSSLGWTALRRDLEPTGAETFERFLDMGLWIPDATSEDVQMKGRMATKRGEVTAGFKWMKEHSERHNCACCGSQILMNTFRVTVDLDRKEGVYDHHHYHGSCFSDSVLPKFNLDSIVEAPLKLG